MTPWTGEPGRLLCSMGFPRQEYLSGLPFPCIVSLFHFSHPSEYAVASHYSLDLNLFCDLQF